MHPVTRPASEFQETWSPFANLAIDISVGRGEVAAEPIVFANKQSSRHCGSNTGRRSRNRGSASEEVGSTGSRGGEPSPVRHLSQAWRAADDAAFARWASGGLAAICPTTPLARDYDPAGAGRTVIRSAIADQCMWMSQ